MKLRMLIAELQTLAHNGHGDDEVEFVNLKNCKGSWFTTPLRPKIAGVAREPNLIRICIQDERLQDGNEKQTGTAVSE